MQTDRQDIPKWLKQIQENSWELELLISGGAIFTLYQLSDYFLEFIFTVKFTSHIPGTDLFIVLGMFGLKVLTLGFTAHLLLRAFWLGLVCVNYVYPGGIKADRLKFQKPFKNSEENGGDLRDQITNVDRWCGTVMYLSILSSCVIFGGILIFLTIVTLPLQITGGGLVLPYIWGVLSIWLLYLIDLVAGGALRRIPVLSYLLYPIFVAFDLISLRRVYGRSLAMFASNMKRWRFLIGFMLFFCATSFFTYMTLYRTMHWPNPIDSRQYRWEMTANDIWWSRHTYRDQMADEDMSKATLPNIQSDIITENYLRLWIPYNADYDSSVNSIETEDDRFLENIIKVELDGVELDSIVWYGAWHSDIDQIGIRSNVYIGDLANGHYVLTVSDRYYEPYSIQIPFWKDVKQ